MTRLGLLLVKQLEDARRTSLPRRQLLTYNAIIRHRGRRQPRNTYKVNTIQTVSFIAEKADFQVENERCK